MSIQDSGTIGNLIEGNLIGTDATGLAPLGNTGAGVRIFRGATDNTVGGTAARARNVLSGNTNYGVALFETNTSNNAILGNYIGLGIDGTTAVGNGNLSAATGVYIGSAASNNLIGGTTAGARNVIGSNKGSATFGEGVRIELAAAGTSSEGNYIGTDFTGSLDRGNGGNGVLVFQGATSNTIGGGAPGAGNLITGTHVFDVHIQDAGTTGNKVQGNQIGTDAAASTLLGSSTRCGHRVSKCVGQSDRYRR